MIHHHTNCNDHAVSAFGSPARPRRGTRRVPETDKHLAALRQREALQGFIRSYERSKARRKYVLARLTLGVRGYRAVRFKLFFACHMRDERGARKMSGAINFVHRRGTFKMLNGISAMRG